MLTELTGKRVQLEVDIAKIRIWNTNSCCQMRPLYYAVPTYTDIRQNTGYKADIVTVVMPGDLLMAVLSRVNFFFLLMYNEVTDSFPETLMLIVATVIMLSSQRESRYIPAMKIFVSDIHLDEASKILPFSDRPCGFLDSDHNCQGRQSLPEEGTVTTIFRLVGTPMTMSSNN